MGQTILKDWQKEVIRFIAFSEAKDKFYLTGGTALAAYYLQHRISDDLDFFFSEPADSVFIHKLAQEIKEAIEAKEMRYSRIYDRNQFFYIVGRKTFKVEFSRYPFVQLRNTKTYDGIAVDSEYDIAVNKFAALLDRFDPKDFVDLYFLIQKYPLKRIRKGYEKKFGVKADPLFIGSELNKAQRIKALPKMVKPLTAAELKKFFISEAKRLGPEILQ